MKIIANESKELQKKRILQFSIVCETVDDINLMMKYLPSLFLEDNNLNRKLQIIKYGECLSMNKKIIPLEILSNELLKSLKNN